MMNHEELAIICFDALHLISLDQGWDLATADMLRTAMLARKVPMIPESVTTLDIYTALTPSIYAYDHNQTCIHSFEAVSLDDLDFVIKRMREGASCEE